MKTPNLYSTKTTAMGVLMALATAAFLMLPTIAAQAHDTLESTVPAKGSVVRTVPTQIGLTFDHTPLAIGSVIRVEDANGIDRADGPVAIVDNHVTQAITPGAPEGNYTVIWRVASADGHAIEGTFTFTAGTASSTAGPKPSPLAAPPATGTSTSTGPPTGIIVAAAVALLLTIAFVWLAVTVKRRLNRPDS
ncbi:copper resistance CopC family protein [Pseudarthrobacter sp. NIBRBAC000502770]|uniref:copper resistance CopC family protein n=1 Tax=Pseudarthrobacter sp. NIBRBAC000502770 TaxID=2590785 RepID=UPI0011401DB9|nr:copper resistance CopC family protein [Pseudarthrobacter sp. NIBRBAC000502770]QDG88118.1 copper resistance protein CopC [Pseudarthrobacter sp. NIBRBAC000502770]